MKNNVELVGFVLLLIGTLGLLANEFVFGWGSYATVIFAAANVVGLAVLAYAHWGMKKGKINMVTIAKATIETAVELTEIQTRTFDDDNKLKPAGCSMEGPPGYDSVKWNSGWIKKTPYYQILFNDQIVGGIIIFPLEEERYELGRMWVDPNFQNKGIGQQAVRQMFKDFPEVEKWFLGTPSWAYRNQHFYEKLGFVKIRETELTPI